MAVLRNLKEIPVPDFATADKKSGEVSVYTVEPVTNRRKRYIIGRLLSNGNMNVTSGFKEHHRDLWEKYFGENTLPTNCPLSCGLYAVMLWLASKTGLYACIQDAFGNKNGNALLDLASFGIERNSNPDYSLPSYLASHATFSTVPKSEGEYSRLFSSITQEEIASFKEMWVKALSQSFEVKKVWLSLDETRFACSDTESLRSCDAKSTDSNDTESSGYSSVEVLGYSDTENLSSSIATGSDCSAKSRCGCSDVSQHDCSDESQSVCDGKNPTNVSQAQHTKTNAPRSRASVGRITAITTDLNLPVTWFTFKGTAPAADDIKHVADFLAAFGIEVQGIILDRRFNQQDVVDTVESLGYDWVMMLRDDCEAHQRIFEQYAHTIRFNSEYLVGTEDLFAVSGQAPLFNNSKRSSYVSLFFNAMRSAERQVQLVREAYNCVSSINRKIESAASKIESRVSGSESGTSGIKSGASASKSVVSGTESGVSNYESVLAAIEIPPKHQQWVYLDTNEDGSPVAKLNHQALNAASQKIGYYCIASSLDLPCLSAKSIYSMRETVADGFSVDAGHSLANGLSVDEELSVADRLSADDWLSAVIPHLDIHAGRAHTDASHDAGHTHSHASAVTVRRLSDKSGGAVGARSYASADAVRWLSAKSDGSIGEHSDASYALDESIQSALSCGFISSVLRALLSMIAKAEDTDVHRLIQGFADVRVLRTSSKDTYSIDNIAKKKYLAIIKNLGITEQCLKDIAAETYIVRDGAPLSHDRVIPNLIEVKDKYGFNKQRGIELSELDSAVSQDMKGLKKRKPGRPKGSKNKSTLEREARMAHTTLIATESRATTAANTVTAASAANATSAASPASAASASGTASVASAHSAVTTDNKASAARLANEASDSLQTTPALLPQAMNDQASSSIVSQSSFGSSNYMGAKSTTGSSSHVEAHSTSSSMSSIGLGKSIEQNASEAQAMAALDEQPAKSRSKGGRPKGSKNKKTLEREAQLRRDLEKRGPGRPKGSKNKSTLEREAIAAQTQVKRGRGRPKGSKNKSTLEKDALAAQTQVKRGRGRPKGSKNKSTLEREAAALLVPKRGPGRPKGSRTKPAPPPNTLLLR